MSNITKSVEQLKSEAAALLQQAEQAEAEAQRAAAEAAQRERDEKRQVELRAQATGPVPAGLASQTKHLQRIADELEQMAHDAEWLKSKPDSIQVVEPVRTVRKDDDTGLITSVDWREASLRVQWRGQPVYASVSFEAQMRSQGSSRFYSRSVPTGKLLMKVGSHSDRTTVYPQKKDGTFNYEAAAQVYLAQLRTMQDRADAEDAKVSNTGARNALVTKYGLDQSTSIVQVGKSSSHYDGRRRRYVESTAPVGMVFLHLERTVTPEQADAILKAAQKCGVLKNARY